MMKKENGVTLIALAITIVVLLVLTTVTLTIGGDTINEVEADKAKTQLSVVQQAIFQRYFMLKSSEGDKKVPTYNDADVSFAGDTDRPEELIGMRIVSEDTLAFYEFEDYKQKYDDEQVMYYESYYYLLSEADLEEIGVTKKITDDSSNNTYSYIVNYLTGEVFDIEHKVYINEYNEQENPYSNGVGNTKNLTGTTYNFVD